jgi:hypothetical protein
MMRVTPRHRRHPIFDARAVDALDQFPDPGPRHTHRCSILLGGSRRGCQADGLVLHSFDEPPAGVLLPGEAILPDAADEDIERPLSNGLTDEPQFIGGPRARVSGVHLEVERGRRRLTGDDTEFSKSLAY